MKRVFYNIQSKKLSTFLQKEILSLFSYVGVENVSSKQGSRIQ
ncbi:hypothetical protein LEP1GSC062_3579 [Leptospira alexanderi serovar Manhao 3 str. L 60]|uniref:Uncharacterized protein n=1 Tax=Leptospira alexanderi serovar Manhao 3 str. L 60 TaxID=1049759 RepID=V6I4A5_9LEPT|nr:hypothetical protein LEP1GSC062_3579 [Leptospira alexanderi serovar Manhao 3 str. L 60]